MMKQVNTTTLAQLTGGAWGAEPFNIPGTVCPALIMGSKNPVFGPLPGWLVPWDGLPAHCLAIGGGAGG